MEQNELIIPRFSKFTEAFQAGDVNNAARLAQASVEWLKGEILRSEMSDRERNHLFILAVFWRSLFDLCILRRAVMESQWEENGPLVDYVWTKLCDFRDRFEYSRPVITGPVVELGVHVSTALEQYFLQRFGPGKYLSAELLIKKRDCSICKADLRSCEHITGRLYAGRLCLAVPVDFQGMGASLVDNPKDPRCRIWPWNYNAAEGKFTAPLMTCFRIDDFSHPAKLVSESPRLTCDIALSEPDFLLSFFRTYEETDTPVSSASPSVS